MHLRWRDVLAPVGVVVTLWLGSIVVSDHLSGEHRARREASRECLAWGRGEGPAPKEREGCEAWLRALPERVR